MILYQLLPLVALGVPIEKGINPWADKYGKSSAELNTHLTSTWSQKRQNYLKMRAGMNRLWNTGRKQEILSTRRPELGAEIAQREAMAARNKQSNFVMPHLRQMSSKVRAENEL